MNRPRPPGVRRPARLPRISLRRLAAARRRPARRPTVRRDTVHLRLPASPGGTGAGPVLTLTAPAALALPELLADGGVAGVHTAALATFLTAAEHAPAGAVLDVGAGLGLFALVAAAYGDRVVRALEAVPDLAHVARQSAATSGLAVVVEERGLVGAGSLDAYVAERGLAPAVVHLGPAAAADVLTGAVATVARYRPWLVWSTATPADGDSARAAGARLPGYTVHSLATAGADVAVEVHLLSPADPGPAFWDRCRQWHSTLVDVRP